MGSPEYQVRSIGHERLLELDAVSATQYSVGMVQTNAFVRAAARIAEAVDSDEDVLEPADDEYDQ